MGKSIYSTCVVALTVLGVATVASSAVPPPPVNQNIGLHDSVFNNIQETDCRGCHGDNPPAGVPVDTTYLPDRHHLKVGTSVPAITAAPNAADASGNYACLTCHSMEFNTTTFAWQLKTDFRDCLVCHEQIAGQASVHHLTSHAQNGDCTKCHSYLESWNSTAKYIPDYPVSLVTPWPSDKPKGDFTVLNSKGTEAGNCTFCHDSLAASDGTATFASGLVDDVFNNRQTHHSTGLWLATNPGPAGSCATCHDIAEILTMDPDADYTGAENGIRGCEGCHTVKSLHNIQAASNQSAIVPGSEPAYFGHIGAQNDCYGCHGFKVAASADAAPYAGPVYPAIDRVSPQAIVAGADTTITLAGSGFVSIVPNPYGGPSVELTSEVQLTGPAGNAIVLAAESITPTSIVARLPVSLAPGNYSLAAVKGQNPSNPMPLVVSPAVVIDAASCSGATVTITGSGFSSYLAGDGTGTGVSGTVTVVSGKGKNKTTQTVTENASVVSWSDTEIVVTFEGTPVSVTVDSVFGSVAVDLSCVSPGGNQGNKGKGKNK